MMVREVMYVYLILLGAGNPTADFTMDYFLEKMVRNCAAAQKFEFDSERYDEKWDRL